MFERRREQSGEPAKLVISMNELPSLPVALGEVLRVASDPDGSMADLHAAVQRDVSLAARVLKVANSPLYGFRREMETIRQALVMLGPRRVRSIASAMSVGPMFRPKNPGLVDGVTLWRHALATAVWSQEVAAFIKYHRTDQLFTSGLMHDLGIIVLNHCAPERYTKVLVRTRDEGLPLSELETEQLGTNHAWVGATLSAKWMLPPQLTQLISHHEDTAVPAEPEAQILMVADWLAARSGNPEFPWMEAGAPPVEVLQVLGIGRDQLEQILQRGTDVKEYVAAIGG